MEDLWARTSLSWVLEWALLVHAHRSLTVASQAASRKLLPIFLMIFSTALITYPFPGGFGVAVDHEDSTAYFGSGGSALRGSFLNFWTGSGTCRLLADWLSWGAMASLKAACASGSVFGRTSRAMLWQAFLGCELLRSQVAVVYLEEAEENWTCSRYSQLIRELAHPRFLSLWMANAMIASLWIKRFLASCLIASGMSLQATRCLP